MKLLDAVMPRSQAIAELERTLPSDQKYLAHMIREYFDSVRGWSKLRDNPLEIKRVLRLAFRVLIEARTWGQKYSKQDSG